MSECDVIILWPDLYYYNNDHDIIIVIIRHSQHYFKVKGNDYNLNSSHNNDWLQYCN